MNTMSEIKISKEREKRLRELAKLMNKQNKIEFAQRFDKVFQIAQNVNFFPLRNIFNLLFRIKSKPNFSIASINPSEKPKGKYQIDISQPIK